ncbi:MAG: hypothetical protein AAGA29_09090 [Planctomycetota bacterium]
MRIRTSALVLALCSGTFLSVTSTASATALTQDAQPTAQELYSQGIELYEAGQLQEAQAVLRRVDELQLPAELRPDFYNAIATIEQRLAGIDVQQPGETAQAQPEVVEPVAEVSATELLAKGDDAMLAGNYADALGYYQSLMAGENASDTQRSRAGARIAQAQRQINGDASAARRLIALAERDLAAGNMDAAQAKLLDARNSGAQLSPFDEEGIDDKLARISEYREAQAAVAQAEAVETPTAGSNDELTQAQQRLAEAEAQIAALQHQLSEAESQVASRPASSDLLAQARMQSAEDKVAEGDEAMENGQIHLAVQLYEEAALLDSENAEIATKLADAQALVNQDLRPADPLNNAAADIAIIRQETVARYEQAMERASDALANKQYDAGVDAVIEARTILNANRSAFSETERNEMIARAASMQAGINEARAINEAQIAAQAAAEQEAAEREAEERARVQRVEQVQERLRNARTLQADRRYAEAIDELEAALFIDPHNAAVQTLRDLLQDVMAATEAIRLRRELDIMRTNHQLLNDEAIIPYDELLTYPGEWPELTQMRLAGLEDNTGETEANRTAQLAMRRVVTVNFDSAGLGSVIDYIRDTTGANITVNWPALEIPGIDQDTLISISLARVPAEQLLKLVLEQASANAFEDDKAGYSIIEGIVQISTLAELKTSTEVRLYDIRDLLVQVPNFSNAPAFDLNEALSNTNSGGSNGGGGGGGGGGGSGGLFGDDTNDNLEDTPSRDELIDEIIELIQDTVGNQDEWLDDDSSIRELNGNLIVKSTNDNHRQIFALLGRLRETRAIQISVEARFLLVDEHFLEEFGVDLDVAFGAMNTDTLLNIDTDNDGVPDATDGLPDNGSNWHPTTISQNSAANSFTGGNAPQSVAGVPAPVFHNASGNTAGGIANRVTNSLSPVVFTGGDGGAIARGLELGVGFVDDLQVNLLVSATLAQQNSLSLTAPRITFFNGQRAFVMVAQQISFISDLEPIPDTGGFDPTLSVTQSGVILDVEGTISADRRYVTMTLRPSLATVRQPIRTIPQDGAPVTNPITGVPEPGGSAFIEAPEVEITQVRATVSIPDRGTLLVGGQRLVGEAEIESGVPVLSKIPYVNRLFTNTAIVKDERTLLILIKPTIIIQSEQEELLYPGLNDNPDAFDIGRSPTFNGE